MKNEICIAHLAFMNVLCKGWVSFIHVRGLFNIDEDSNLKKIDGRPFPTSETTEGRYVKTNDRSIR